MNKILIIGPAWVGDMVMAQTLFITLKQQHPDCIIDVLAPSWSEPLLARMPEVRHAITMPLGHGQLNLRARYQLGVSLRSEKYQHAYVLPNSWKSALIPFFAKIPIRTGWRGEMRLGLLNDCRRLDTLRYPLMIERFIALATPPKTTLASAPDLPKPALQVDNHQIQASLQALQLSKDKPILALCPGAEFGPAKQWPAEHYGNVAKHYHQQGWQIWLFGGAKDTPVAQEIQQHADHCAIDLTGKTNLGQAIDLLAQASLVISNDSGLMHIACATGRPTVVVYGSSSPAFTPPLGDQVKIESLNLDCSPCFARTCPLGHTHCLHQLLPAKIIITAETLLNP